MKRKFGLVNILIITIFCFFQVPAAVSEIIGIDTDLRGDDYGNNNFPIGFTFNYWGNDYTEFGVSTNGWISLENNATGIPYTNPDFPMSGDLDGMIAPFFDDIRTDVTGQPEGIIYYLTIGDAPNRKLIVQWNDQYFFGSNLPMGTFELILHEGSNEITFQYRYLRDQRSLGGSATIGLDDPESDEFVRYSFKTDSLSEEKAIAFTPDGQGGYSMSSNAPYSWIDISGLTNLPPEDGGEYTASTTIPFTWEPTSGANAYRLDVATGPNQADVIESLPLENVTSYEYGNDLVEGTTYYARVAASLNFGGTYQNPSLFSDGITIDRTAPVPNTPTATRGTEDSIVDFHFTGTDNFVIASYHIQIAENDQFSTVLDETDVAVPEGNATNNATYSYQSNIGRVLYVRAYAVDGAGNQSDYSQVAGPFEVPIDTAGLSFSMGMYSVQESAGSVEVILELSAVVAETVTVEYETSDGTATAGNDYTEVAGTLTFNPGETTKSFSIPILDNEVDTEEEQFNVTLSNAVNAIIDSPQAVVRIIRDQIEAPVIERPLDGDQLADTVVTVRGSAPGGSFVDIFINGDYAGTAVASSYGWFNLPGVLLAEGENVITAVAASAYAGISPASEPVSVTLDPMPETPGGMLATPGDTVVSISWQASTEPDVQGYNIYRDGMKLNDDPLTATTFEEMFLTNGKEYTYEVTSVDENFNESEPGEIAVTPVAGPEW